jgi:broad specificity phosphatase PhoE
MLRRIEHMTTIYMIRHGSTPWGEDENRYTGISDVPLSELGRHQAATTAGALESVSFNAIYSSPLSRSIETAEIISASRNMDVRVEADLIEVDFGQWEGMRKADIIAADPDTWDAWVRHPDHVAAGTTGESGEAARLRGHAAVERLVMGHGDETIAVIGHNTLTRLLVVASLGAPLSSYRHIDLGNCSISLLEILDPAQWRWNSLNGLTHLSAVPL